MPNQVKANSVQSKAGSPVYPNVYPRIATLSKNEDWCRLAEFVGSSPSHQKNPFVINMLAMGEQISGLQKWAAYLFSDAESVDGDDSLLRSGDL